MWDWDAYPQPFVCNIGFSGHAVPKIGRHHRDSYRLIWCIANLHSSANLHKDSTMQCHCLTIKALPFMLYKALQVGCKSPKILQSMHAHNILYIKNICCIVLRMLFTEYWLKVLTHYRNLCRLPPAPFPWSLCLSWQGRGDAGWRSSVEDLGVKVELIWPEIRDLNMTLKCELVKVSLGLNPQDFIKIIHFFWQSSV